MFRALSLLGIAAAAWGCHAHQRGWERVPEPVAYEAAPRWPAPDHRDPAARAVAFARAQVGKAYCWGGTGPCFDCSGLTHSSWSSAGRTIPRTSEGQRQGLTPVSWDDLRPGDVLWRPGHVGLYVGDGWAIHAPGRGKSVSYQAANRYRLALRP